MVWRSMRSPSPHLEAYQAFATGFVAILISGVLAEARAARDETRPQVTVVAFVLVSLTALVGAIISIVVLMNGRPPSRFVRGLDFGLFVTGIVLVATLVIAPLLSRTTLVVSGLLILGAGAGAAVGYLLSRPKAYEVYGTCASGGCGVNVRSEPSRHSQRLDTKLDGDLVHIVCQVNGERLEASNHVSSRVWDKLNTGGFISDLYVDTPGVDEYSSQLRQCDPAEVGENG
jgi:hypothetical protein